MRLVTARESAADEVVEWLEAALKNAKETNCCGVAVALVRPDGSVSATTFGQASRLLLLGAVTDLQYDLAKGGDE